jgi:lectin family protein/stigma-specific protein Stig1
MKQGARRRRVLPWLGVFLGVTAGASCTALSGVDQLHETDCGADCGAEEGALDARIERRPGADADSGPACAGCGGVKSPSCCGGVCVDLASDPEHCGSCETSCASGACGTTLESWASASWSANQSASIGPGQFGTKTGILTTNASNQGGTLFYRHPIVVDSFTATFSFYIGGGMADPDAGVLTTADGMAFVFATNGPEAFGLSGGGCFGVCGLDGFGVEFDTFDNDGCGDTNANHVGLDSLAVCSIPDCSDLPTMLFSYTDLPFMLDDGVPHTATVVLDSGVISVTVDGMAAVTKFPLPKEFVPGTPYYFGFGGGTGGGTDYHEVGPDLTISFPTPRCL